MTTEVQRAPQDAADLFGRKVVARLSDATTELPYEITERLRAARVQALARRKRVRPLLAPRVVAAGGGAAALGFGDDGPSLGERIAGALPILVLAAGLVLIHSIHSDHRASELAEVDTQLLTDDLPPAAYADPGFVQFLKLSGGGE